MLFRVRTMAEVVDACRGTSTRPRPSSASSQHGLRISGIPPDWVCADLREFFAPEVERQAFACFHYLHRADPAAAAAGLCCASAALDDVEEARALVLKYDGRPWSESSGHLCRLEPIELLRHGPTQPTPASRFRRRAQRREEAAAGAGGDSIARWELCPPSWLPRGNVGSSTAELRAALATCRLSARDLSALGLECTPLVGGAALSALCAHAAEPCAYSAGRPVRASRQDAGSFRAELCAAGGPLRATVAERRASARAAASARGRGNCLAALGLVAGPGAREREHAGDACSEDAEEWDRHEATTEPGAWEANDRPTFAYWSSANAHLFEEEVEGVWEKGGSGLAFYTDEAYWHAQTSAEERLVDGWDTHGRDEEGDLRSAELPQAAAAAQGPATADGHRAGFGAARRRARARALAGDPGRRGPARHGAHGLALDASNVGYRLLGKMGWTPARPALGKRNQGAVQPVSSHVVQKRGRRGLG